MGGEWGWCAPVGQTADFRRAFTMALDRADIARGKAIRAISAAGMVHIDP